MGSRDIDRVPYWNMNIPETEHTATCPEALLNLSDKDIGILSTPDAKYQTQTWEQACSIVASGRLGDFQRLPSDLRRYRLYMHKLIQQHGSVASFVLRERLRWQAPLVARGEEPFACDDDYKILYNDWPYGIDPRIVHLVIWTKFPLEDDPVTGRLTSSAQKSADDFVTRTFSRHLPEGQVIWFKNYGSLKSVHAVEHIHVMLFDPDPSFVQAVTNGDVPQCANVNS